MCMQRGAGRRGRHVLFVRNVLGNDPFLPQRGLHAGARPLGRKLANHRAGAGLGQGG